MDHFVVSVFNPSNIDYRVQYLLAKIYSETSQTSWVDLTKHPASLMFGNEHPLHLQVTPFQLLICSWSEICNMKFNRQQFVVSSSSLDGSSFQMVSRIFCLNLYMFRVRYFDFSPEFHALQYHGPIEVKMPSKLRKRNRQLHNFLKVYLLQIFLNKLSV